MPNERLDLLSFTQPLITLDDTLDGERQRLQAIIVQPAVKAIDFDLESGIQNGFDPLDAAGLG